MEIKKSTLIALSAYVILLVVSFTASITFKLGEAESVHLPTSVWMYVRRLLMLAGAVLLPLLTGGKGIAGYGWKIKGKWIAISVILGIIIGFGNEGGFDPRVAVALLIAAFHTFTTEIFFRAYLITTFSEMTKRFWPPVIVSSLLYGIFYMTVWPIWNRPFGPNLLFVGLFGGLGIIFGSCYKKSGSFLVPWLMHFLGVLQYKVFFA